MPELPEVETLKSQLQSKIPGRVLAKVVVLNEAILKTPRAVLESKIPGKKIKGVARRGKFLCLDFEAGLKLWLHLGMTGQILFTKSLEALDPHVHFILEFQGTQDRLIYRDVRKFGGIFLTNGQPETLPEGVRLLAPDPFEMPGEAFVSLLKARKGRIKNLLMNQRLVAGLGNIYADESLHRAGIRPNVRPFRLARRRLARLHEAILETLREAIRAGGSTIDDYLHADGGKGSFQNFHRVYGRKGGACPACGTSIRRVVLAGRSSFFCPTCQK